MALEAVKRTNSYVLAVLMKQKSEIYRLTRSPVSASPNLRFNANECPVKGHRRVAAGQFIMVLSSIGDKGNCGFP